MSASILFPNRQLALKQHNKNISDEPMIKYYDLLYFIKITVKMSDDRRENISDEPAHKRTRMQEER